MLGELTVLVNIANSIMCTNRILYIRNWHYNLSLSVMGLSLNLSILGSTYLRALTMKGEGGRSGTHTDKGYLVNLRVHSNLLITLFTENQKLVIKL